MKIRGGCKTELLKQGCADQHEAHAVHQIVDKHNVETREIPAVLKRVLVGRLLVEISAMASIQAQLLTG